MQEILKLVKRRRSLRVPFDTEQPIANQDVQRILQAARWTPTAHNMQNFEIMVVDDKKILEAFGRIERPISETFVRENYPLLSFSEEELRKRKVGILGTMFPVSWRTPDFKLENVDKKDIESMRRPFPTSPLLLIVVYDPSRRAPASEGDFLGILSLGCAMENMWLMANSLGIGFHIMSSLSSVPIEKKVKSILDIPENLLIAFTCRLGYPKIKPPKYVRVRRDIKAFVHYNRW